MSERLTNTLKPCPVCSAQVRPDNLEKHLRKVHPAYMRTLEQPKRAPFSTQSKPPLPPTKSNQRQTPVPLNGPRKRAGNRANPFIEIDGYVTVDEASRVVAVTTTSNKNSVQPVKTTQSAPIPGTDQRKTIYPVTVCPICQQKFEAQFLINHYRNQHGVEVVKHGQPRKGMKRNGSEMICLKCGKCLRSAEVSHHRKRCAFYEVVEPAVRKQPIARRPTATAPSPRTQQAKQNPPRKRKGASGHRLQTPAHSSPGFEDHEPDGGKYMGWNRRENGKFGSMPLYDDYSDESDA